MIFRNTHHLLAEQQQLLFLGTFTDIIVSREMTSTKYSQVEHLQSSHKREPNLKVNHEKTVVGSNIIKFYYTENNYSNIIRAYIDSVTSIILSCFILELAHFFQTLLSIILFQTSIKT